ncbi:MAG: TetR/AcrR family transcriptional regulator [Myxococcales bacterium]|nr:TetR/AcrR family transcriptional regulator [Myxococcales bacterium]
MGADAEETQARILGAAGELFSVQGVAATSMRQIAKSAGVSQSTVHHYFDNKDGLYLACVEQMYNEVDKLTDRLVSVVPNADSAAAAVAMVVSETYRFGLRNQRSVLFLNRLTLETGEAAIPQRANRLLQAVDMFSALLARWTKRDEVEMRMALYNLNFLITRLVVADKAEVAAVLKMDPAAPDTTIHEEAEKHLIAFAKGAIGLTGHELGPA